MNPVERNGSPHPLYTSIRFDDFDVTWAGPNPFRPGFCFGSDDGRLRFTDEEGKIVGEQFPQVASREAINGIAFHDGSLAVSTRAEVTLFSLLDGHTKSVSVAEIPVGAYGVIASASGYFVAPLGVAGLLLLKPERHSDRVADPYGMADQGIYFYRASALPNPSGSEVLVFAIRRNGIGIMPFSGTIEKHDMTTAHFKNLDIVDVCPLEVGSGSGAFASIGIDGTLILFRDPLTDSSPSTIKFKMVQGTVYGLASCRGHVFVLTSKALYVLADLAGRFLRGESVKGVATQILTVPTEGVDLGLSGDKYLLAVTADNVLRFDIDSIERSIPVDAASDSPDPVAIPLQPLWERRGMSQETRALAGVA
jgi:hypothetical protein